MTKGNQQLYTVLILAITFCGAFAFKGRGQVASFLQAKTDFIPDRCGTEAEDSTTPCNDQVRIGSKFPACVCFWNGTCEFRSDKTRCQWCNEEGAASVNAGERCPKLNEDLLYVCPVQQNTDVTDPIVIGPMQPVQPSSDLTVSPVLPVSVSPVKSAVETAEETAEATAQPSNLLIAMQPAELSHNLTVSPVLPVSVSPVKSAEKTAEATAQPLNLLIAMKPAELSHNLTVSPVLPVSVSPVKSAEETAEATAQPSNLLIAMQPAELSNNLNVSPVLPVSVSPVQSAEETAEATAQPSNLLIAMQPAELSNNLNVSPVKPVSVRPVKPVSVRPVFPVSVSPVQSAEETAEATAQPSNLLIAMQPAELSNNLNVSPVLPVSVSPVQSAEETAEATAQPSNLLIAMQPAELSHNLNVSPVKPVTAPSIAVAPVKSTEETPKATAQPADMSIDTTSEPVSTTISSKRRLSSTKHQDILSPPLQKATTTRGCICTADGVCKRQNVADWSTSCQNDQVVAVVEDGPCPKSSNCTLKPPSNAYKCQASDRVQPGGHKMCPMFVVFNGCVCYNDGTCVNKATSSCASCQDDTVVSVTTNSQCDCV